MARDEIGHNLSAASGPSHVCEKNVTFQKLFFKISFLTHYTTVLFLFGKHFTPEALAGNFIPSEISIYLILLMNLLLYSKYSFYIVQIEVQIT